MPAAIRPAIFFLFAAILSSFASLPAQSQTNNKTSVFSKLPAAQQPSAQQKRRLGGARTYAEKQQIKRQLNSTKKPKSNNALAPDLNQKTQLRTGVTRNAAGRSFGPRQRVRAQSRQRGGQAAQGGQPTTK